MPVRRRRPLRPRPGPRAGQAYAPTPRARRAGPPRRRPTGRPGTSAQRVLGAASAVASATVRMVPATGRATARRAALATVRSSTATIAPGGARRSLGLRCSNARQTLVNISARIAPELPWAERMAAWTMASRLARLHIGHGLGDPGQGQPDVGAGIGVGHRKHVHGVQRVGRIGDHLAGAAQPGVVDLPQGEGLLRRPGLTRRPPIRRAARLADARDARVLLAGCPPGHQCIQCPNVDVGANSSGCGM